MEHVHTDDPFLDELYAFLCQTEVEQFFAQHPNGLTLPQYVPPASWTSWWNWHPSDPPDDSTSLCRWELLWKYYAEPQKISSQYCDRIPDDLRTFIDSLRHLQLVRDRGSEASQYLTTQISTTHDPTPPEEKIHGMSPKKAHEVVRTVEYLKDVLERLSESGLHVEHVVDVGAGQVRTF